MTRRRRESSTCWSRIDFRMSTTGVYSDIVLPTASWYEKDDLNTSDMHPFIHPLQAAVDPAYESKSDWEIFKSIAKKFSEIAPEVLGVETDIVQLPLLHDTPGELAQAHVRDWKKGECDLIPGKTAPNYIAVERDYPNLYKKLHLSRAADGKARQRRQGDQLGYQDRGGLPARTQWRRA